jgi:hypothetical protein
LTFERGSAADLAAQLRAFASDSFVRRMSQGAYDAFWRTPPTMNAHVDRLLATYRDVLGGIVPKARIPRAS